MNNKGAFLISYWQRLWMCKRIGARPSVVWTQLAYARCLRADATGSRRARAVTCLEQAATGADALSMNRVADAARDELSS
jgi:hypothetical protein